MRISKESKKEYKSYLGTRTNKKFKTRDVWTNKANDKYWYFTINPKTGYPKYNYLKIK